jgi:hypothetical protein
MFLVTYWTLYQIFNSEKELVEWINTSGNRAGVKAIYKISEVKGYV